MKIDYTNFLRDKPLETDPEKIGKMKARLDQAIIDGDITGELGCEYYADGCVRVEVNGVYYGMFDANTGKFFSGAVGD